MKVFVINLDERIDRWLSLESEIEKLGLDVISISAVSFRDLDQADFSFVSKEVAACFLSHIKALEAFLESGDSHGLIVEDDFFVENRIPHMFSSLLMNLNFLQVGYLKTSLIERLNIRYQNFFNIYLGLLLRAGVKLKFPKALMNKYLLLERRGVSLGVALNDVRPGAHAYIVDRKFATYCRQINIPIALSTDALFIAISQMRTVRVGRTRKSYFGQTKSPTSIAQRFKAL